MPFSMTTNAVLCEILFPLFIKFIFNFDFIYWTPIKKKAKQKTEQNEQLKIWINTWTLFKANFLSMEKFLIFLFSFILSWLDSISQLDESCDVSACTLCLLFLPLLTSNRQCMHINRIKKQKNCFKHK